MAFSHSIAVMALLVLCFAVAPSTQKFTLNVDEVAPNRGLTTEILQLQTGFAQIGELDVSTLRVESDEGVAISGQGGFVVDGAAFGSSSAGSVSVSTTLLDSEINVIGANALDFFGTTVDFSSASGSIDLNAQADFQFVGLGTFNAAVDNFISNGDDVSLEAAAGAISFSMSGDFSGSGSQLHVEGVNGLSVAVDGDVSLTSTFNNLDVNGKRVLFDSQSVAMFADRNNLVLAASKDLSASFDDIFIDADEGVLFLSSESSINTNAERVFLSASDGAIAFRGLQEVTISADDLTFTGAAAQIASNGGVVGKVDVDMTLTASGLISAFSQNNFLAKATAGNVELISSAGNIGISGADNARVLADGTASFTAVGDIDLAAVGGMYIRADQAIVYGSQLPVSTAFPVDVVADEVDLRGATVNANVQNFALSGTGTSSTMRFQTFEFSRDSTVEFSSAGSIDLSSDTVSISGGDASFTANGSLGVSGDSVRLSAIFDYGSGFIATGDSIELNSVEGVEFSSGGNSDYRASSIDGTAEEIFFGAGRSMTTFASDVFFSSLSFLSTAEDKQRISSAEDLEFIADDALFIDTSGFARFLSGGEIDIDATETFDLSSTELYLAAGGSLLLASDDQLSFDADESIVFAGDNLLTSSDDVFIGGNGDVFFLSPSGQPITITSTDFDSTVDDLDLVGFIVNFEGGDVALNSGDHLFQSGDSAPITFTADESISFEPDDTIEFIVADDITFSADEIEINADDLVSTADFDVTYSVTDYELSSGSALFSSSMISVSAETIDIFSIDTVVFDAADELNLSSSSGIIDVQAGGDFQIAGGASFAISSGDSVQLSALTDFTAVTGDWLQNGGDNAISSADATTFTAGDEVNFEGDTIDHIIGNDLLSTSIGDTDIFGEDVVISATNAATFNIGGDITFSPSSPVTVNQEEVNPGSITATATDDAEFIANGHLHFGAGGAFGATGSADADPTNLSAIYIKAAARSAGISTASTNLAITSGGDVRFLVSDWSTGQRDSSGGFDLNLLNTGDALFESDFDAAANGGVSITSDGSSYDAKTGRNVGAVFRGLSDSAQVTSESSSVDFVAANDVFVDGFSFSTEGADAATTNSISSSLGDVNFINIGGGVFFEIEDTGLDIDIDVAGWVTIQSSDIAEGSSFDSNDALTLSSGDIIEVQADRGKVAFTQTGDAPLSAVADGAILFEAASEALWTITGEFAFETQGPDACPADDLDCNVGLFFADNGVDLSADTFLNSAVGDIALRSSLNNDIAVDADEANLTAGSISISSDENTSLLGSVAATAVDDISFVSEGSIRAAAGDLLFMSAADQLFEADHSVFVDAASLVVGGTTSPILNVYAGGLGREFGVEVNAVLIDLVSEQDISIAAEGFRSFSPGSTTFTSDAGVNIQSLGTGRLGNDIIFESGEDLNIDSEQILQTASNILIEYDTNLEFLADEVDIISRRLVSLTSERTTSLGASYSLNARDVSVTSFLKDPVDAIAVGSATGNEKAQRWAADTIDFTSSDDSTFSAAGGIYVTTPMLEASTLASNSDVTFETTGPSSDFLLTAQTIDAEGTRIIFEAGHRSVFGALGTMSVEIGDSITSTSEGKNAFAAANDFSITAAADFELTSTGRLLAYAGDGLSIFSANSGMTFAADHDIIFETTDRNAEDTMTNGIFVTANEGSTTRVGRDFVVDTDGSITLTTEVFDLSIEGVFSDNDPTPSVFDIPFGLLIVAQDEAVVSSASLGMSARDDIIFEASGSSIGSISNVLGEVTTFTSNGPLGFEVSSSGASGDAVLSAQDGISIIVDDSAAFLATGDDFGVGVLSAASSGSDSAEAFGLEESVLFPISMAFVSETDSITVSAEQAKVRFDMRDNGIPAQQALADFYINPGVNGSLTFQASGSTEDGLGFFASAVGTYLISERNIRLEGANVRFTEVGQDRYAPNYGALQYNADFSDLQETRATVYGYESQEWVSLGASKDGLAFDFESDVPFEGILLSSYFVNFQTGGGIVMTAATDFLVEANEGIIGESAASIVLQGRARNDEDIGLLVSVGSTRSYGSATATFQADEELSISAAGSLIANAESTLYFSAGQGGDVNFDVDGGFTYQGGFIDANVEDDVTFLSGGNVEFVSPSNGFVFSADTINISGSDNVDGVSNIYFGNPNFDTGSAGLDEDYYGEYVNGVTGNINIETSGGLFIEAGIFDVASTAALILPEQLDTTCTLDSSIFVNYAGAAAQLCYCRSGNPVCRQFDDTY